MCGRYVSPNSAEAERYFHVNLVRWKFERSFNVAATQPVPVVRLLAGERAGTTVRWGLVPSFANGAPPYFSTLNAPIENLTDGPCWRGPWERQQRCILPATGFYEWHLNKDHSKTPFYFTCDQPTFGFAGLWDASTRQDGTILKSCTMITMPPNDLVAEIDNAERRMPAILEQEDTEAWLNGAPNDAMGALKSYPARRMTAWPVSTRVNTPKINDSGLISRASALQSAR